MVGCGENYNCPANRRASSAGNCVNARTEPVIGHYGEMMSALRRASAVNMRPSSAEMTALSVAMFRVQLDTLFYCCVIILFIATASLSEYDVNKNVIIEHMRAVCFDVRDTSTAGSPLCRSCVCDVLPQLVLHYKSFTSRVPVLRQIHGCVFCKCPGHKIQRAQL
jgi:hypothetical protein